MKHFCKAGKTTKVFYGKAIEAIKAENTSVRKRKTPKPIRKKRHLVTHATDEIHLKHLSDHYWSKKWHFYLHAIFLGNSCDGMPISLLLSLNLNGGLFGCIYIIFCFFLTVPLIYVEIFLGRYTRMTNSQIYRMAPIFFGYSALTFFLNILEAPILIVYICQFLVAALELIINPQYLSECVAPTTTCYDPMTQGKLNGTCAAETFLINCTGSGVVRYAMQNNYWKFRVERTSNYNWEILSASVVTWVFITGFMILGMKVLGNMLRIAAILKFIQELILFAMALTMPGATKGLTNLITFNFHEMTFSQCFLAVTFSSYKFGLLGPTGYMTYSAYTKLEKPGGSSIGLETLLIAVANVAYTLWQLVVFQSICGVLSELMGIPLKNVLLPSTGIYYATVPQFMHYLDAHIIHVILFHLTNWFLEITKLAVDTQMQLLNLYDFLPYLSSYNIYIIPIAGFVGICISFIFSINYFVNMVLPLYTYLMIYSGQACRLFIHSLLIFYSYGVSRLCDDIFYETGRRPVKLWRIIANFIPITLLVGFIVETVDNYTHFQKEFKFALLNASPAIIENIRYSSCGLIAFLVMFIVVGSCVYILRTLNRSTLENLFKPQFYWGPPNANARIARKYFKPQTAIRSSIIKTRLIRFREQSTRFMHEKDLHEGNNTGRIFLDMSPKNEELSKKKKDTYEFAVNIKKKMYVSLQRKIISDAK